MFIVQREDRLGLITVPDAAGDARPVKLADRECKTWQARK